MSDVNVVFELAKMEESVPQSKEDPLSWSPEQVSVWMRAAGIAGAEAIAQKLLEEEVDGETLLGSESKHDVKEMVGVPAG